jgi:hypothetical protein
LLDHYNVLERPVANESDPLQLSFGLTLMQIIDVVRVRPFSSIKNFESGVEPLYRVEDAHLQTHTPSFSLYLDFALSPHRALEFANRKQARVGSWLSSDGSESSPSES